MGGSGLKVTNWLQKVAIKKNAPRGVCVSPRGVPRVPIPLGGAGIPLESPPSAHTSLGQRFSTFLFGRAAALPPYKGLSLLRGVAARNVNREWDEAFFREHSQNPTQPSRSYSMWHSVEFFCLSIPLH